MTCVSWKWCEDENAAATILPLLIIRVMSRHWSVNKKCSISHYTKFSIFPSRLFFAVFLLEGTGKVIKKIWEFETISDLFFIHQNFRFAVMIQQEMAWKHCVMIAFIWSLIRIFISLMLSVRAFSYFYHRPCRITWICFNPELMIFAFIMKDEIFFDT